MVGCTPCCCGSVLARSSLTGGLLHILLFRTLFDCCMWTSRVTQPVQRTPLWPASWLPAVDKGRGSKSVEVQRVWKVYDERPPVHVSAGRCAAGCVS